MTEAAIDTCDVLVVGSGAGGLSCAVTAAHLGLDVLVAEKAEVFGGTTARSGGWLWIPCNPLEQAAGMPDSPEEARAYLKSEAGNFYDPDRVDAFLEAGPKMVEFFFTRTAMEFQLGPTFADYHPDSEGGKDGGRSIVAAPFDGRALGKDIARLRPPLREITLFGLMIGTGDELKHFFNATRSLTSAAVVARLLARFGRDKALHGRAMRLTNGNALAGRLMRSALDKGVRLQERSGVVELIEEDGRVVGAVLETDGRRREVRAARGVVLAAGGFPQDVKRRADLFPHAPTGAEHLSPAPEGNTGDGVNLGETVGGRAHAELPNAAAWVPVSRVPRPDGTTGVFPHFVDRSKPGVIAVNRFGERFVNEANSYHDFIQGLRASYDARPDDGEVCAWFIADHRTIRRYGLGYAKAAPLPLGPELRSGYLKKGDTPEALARAAGFDPDAFAKTLEAYNGPATQGEDPAYGRGTTSYNRSLGDASHQPNPCVAPVTEGPFYAVKVEVGDLGTFAGLRTDARARVLKGGDGPPIPGLYAVGNDAASIMGGAYPGGGITLGPAMTFGWIAAHDLAEAVVEPA
ncbi:MAG: FAD-dependent oxidoreductase [Pseudomonadota bacterium]